MRGRKEWRLDFTLPDLIFPEVDPSLVGRCDCLVEVAGRDSVGAVVALAREEGLESVLPTIAYTGTEFGDLHALQENVIRMRRLLKPLGVRVEAPLVLGSPRWWHATVGRVNSILSRRYGPWHVCVGCHMYLHALRIPLARRVGITRLVSGERLGHAGRRKVNQGPLAVEAYRRLADGFGVRLELPLLEVDDEEYLLDLVGEWGEGKDQPSCTLAGNYLDLDDRFSLDEGMLRAYLDEYLVPVTRRIVYFLLERGEADYQAAVRETLKGARN